MQRCPLPDLPMPETLPTHFQLDDWRVETDLNRLTRHGSSVALEPRTMEVLIYLCERAGEVVGTDEIIGKVWHGRPMGDNPVYKSVAKLRRALGDDSGEPRYIATVPKKGYRLLAGVSIVESPENDSKIPRPLSTLIRKSWPIVAGVVAGVTLAALLFWRPPAESLQPRLVTNFGGSHSQPSFSPDGQSMAFVNMLDGTGHIWLLAFDDTSPRQLTNGEHRDARPRWSPDGKSVLFSRSGSLWTVPVGGGEATELVRNAHNPNWSRDGQRIVFERRYEIWMADADGGNQQRIEGIPRQELPLSPKWPVFSPDGKEIAYLGSEGATPFVNLWRIAIDGGEPEQLTVAAALSSAPVWSPDGGYIYYSSQRGGSRTLWRVAVADRTSTSILTGSGDDDFPDLSADGRTLIYSNSRERFMIVRSEPDNAEEEILHESRQMIFSPELSPDGQTLAWFGQARVGGIQIYTQSLNGGSPTLVTSDPLSTHALPRWSADGTSLYFYHSGKTSAFGKVDAKGGDAEIVVEGWDWNVANGANVSPDGSQIIYSRLTGQVPVQTLIRNLANGIDRSFYATLEYPRWSRDGSDVVGALHTNLKFPGDIAICPADGHECQIIAHEARVPMWSTNGYHLYFVRGFGVSQELFKISVGGASGEQKVMTMAPLHPLGPFYSITDDGDIVWVRHENEPAEIWLADIPAD